MIGKALGHYQIINQIGKGGMGEVYQAKDQKLGRDVAIKVLPEEFAKEADRVARFNREAKLLASLNHPNIAAIYGLEESGGTNFLVLELAEGQTLADRIHSGPIPIEESLKLALQIAEALEAAHEKGVIHRDLKPANIKVTPEGKVKVLDFGLAKAFAEEQAEVNLSNSSTMSNTATQQGMILGTAAYMSPEQARGKPVDRRADIWAFGCVVFEMLTGRAAFSGKDVADILASVIRSEPDWTKLPTNLHWRIREALERCLEKEARNRYSGINDARVEIQKALADPSGVSVQPAITVTHERKLGMMLPWIAAAVVLAAIITGVTVWRLRMPEPPQVIRFGCDLPEDQQFSNLSSQALAISPDGKQIVYSTPKGLYLRSMDKLTAKLIAGTEGNTSTPFFSPDGKWIGYFWGGRLKKIAVNGGAPIGLCATGQPPNGLWWNEDDTIIYGLFFGDIMRVSAGGGNPEIMVKAKAGNLTYPQTLPDGRSILYTSNPYNAQPEIMVLSLKSGETKKLFPGSKAQYLSTGHIIYLLPDKNNLFAVPFDPDNLEVKGDAFPIHEGVRQYAVSRLGTFAYIPGTADAATVRQTMVWVNREGKEEPLSAPPNEYSFFRISPDGKRVALTVGAKPKEKIWIFDIDRGGMTCLTPDEDTDNSTPLWTPDGKRIVYSSSHGNLYLSEVYWRAADGTGEVEKLASAPGRGLQPFSLFGKNLVLWELTFDPPQADIGIVSLEADHIRKPLLSDKYNEFAPRISPDGRWMAYTSNESGQAEVYVRPFPDVNKSRENISTSGGDSPLWSPDGRELFYRSGDSVMAVRVNTEPTFQAEKPTVLFRRTYFGQPLTLWDIHPDGKRFLMLKETAKEAPRKINIVLNWFEELKQKLPDQ